MSVDAFEYDFLGVEGLDRGREFLKTIGFDDEDGNPIDFTGATVEGQIRTGQSHKSAKLCDLTVSHDDAGGNITFSYDDSGYSMPAGPGHGYIDIVVTMPGGKPDSYLVGKIDINDRPTVPA